jgi:hypothetical protein
LDSEHLAGSSEGSREEGSRMMRIIEKIVNEFLDDGIWALGIGAIFIVLCVLGSVAYKERLDAEVKLAEIAAGHFSCESKCECK